MDNRMISNTKNTNIITVQTTRNSSASTLINKSLKGGTSKTQKLKKASSNVKTVWLEILFRVSLSHHNLHLSTSDVASCSMARDWKESCLSCVVLVVVGDSGGGLSSIKLDRRSTFFFFLLTRFSGKTLVVSFGWFMVAGNFLTNYGGWWLVCSPKKYTGLVGAETGWSINVQLSWSVFLSN